MKLSTISICSFLVVIFYTVGFFGFVTPGYTDLFLKLVPFHLLLMFVLMLISQKQKNDKFWMFIVVTYLAGFVVELLGVHTGLIFGNYQYGSTLGVKFAEIPLLIGVNWVLVIYSTGIFLKEFPIKNHIIRAVIGAALISVLDFLIEPVAIRFDYWEWTDLDVPFQNYVAWFIFSFIMLRFFFIMKFKKVNPAATILFIVQFLFFLALNLKVIS